MQRTLGIDLGTTNSVMAYLSRGEPKILLNRQNRDSTPSVVALGRRDELLVGAPARGRGTDAVTSVKRFMGRRFDDPEVAAALDRVAYRIGRGADGDVHVRLGAYDYTPIEISAMILRRLKLDAEQRTHEQFNRAVITVPAYFGERQVAATREAGRLAGFHVLKIINEPTAAALAFGLAADPGQEPRTILVYDLGGGTFDISVLLLVQGMIDVIGIEGDNLLGGDDFDDLLRHRLAAEAEREHGVALDGDLVATTRLRTAAEEAKVALSDQLATEVVLPALGRQAVTLDTEVTREQFEKLVSGAVDRTITLVRKALAEAHLDVDTVDQVLLVGGSTSIPLVEQRLAEVFGAERIRKDVNPMQCVAVGAAVQSALSAEIECPACAAVNDLAEEFCSSCAGSLVGAPKTDCATCHMPVDVDAASCGKCGTALGGAGTGAGAPVHSAPTVSVAKLWTCDQCGKANAPESKSCSVCGEGPARSEGLRCPACGRVNPPGVLDCVSCEQPMPITDPQDITPKDLGVELDDGRMSVVIPKGTNYPTTSPVSRDFHTSGAGATRLEVSVYEGSHNIAERNELCGHVNVQLPPDLPDGTPLTISFGLSSDRTITVSVLVRTPGAEPHVVQLQRFGRLDPQKKEVVSAAREDLVRFLDTLEQELTDRERDELRSSLAQLEHILLEGPGSEPIEPLIKRIREQLRFATEIRYAAARLAMILHWTGKYLTAEQQSRLELLGDQLERAREQADWVAGLAIAEQVQSTIDGLPPIVAMIMEMRTVAAQGSVSPRLSHQIAELTGNLDDAADRNDRVALERYLDQVQPLWTAAAEELGDRRIGPQGPAKPTDRLK
ncbi:Hsp70 family protein [Yinghuangia soli]|uniref:Hsp70 family protein n=1 Tax=Yinghuangia soli TaxID=2908204 RepID=A0AA41Q720_9ACTN|nr:Hsp70 family protein [Yinghuangia soli]MCF2531402.1 Hsp70 family protein [Yinghuangia soli]